LLVLHRLKSLKFKANARYYMSLPCFSTFFTTEHMKTFNKHFWQNESVMTNLYFNPLIASSFVPGLSPNLFQLITSCLKYFKTPLHPKQKQYIHFQGITKGSYMHHLLTV
jgi:hypothetical protein